jgi:hypothetical protein
MVLPDERNSPGESDSARVLLERVLAQLQLVEVLYLRLIGLQTRRLAQPELESELLSEARKVEAELRLAQEELELLGCRGTGEPPRSARPGF